MSSITAVTHEDLRKRAEECERLGRENSLPVLWAMLAPIAYGLALIREGKPAEGIAPLKAGIAFWEASGGKVRSPTLKAFLAEAMALTGDLDNALHLIDEQIAQIERPGWEERLYYAEILRLKGWMLSLKGDLEGAERNFLASLDWARRQQAKMWELRTSTSLARLWQSQGKRQDAYELLAPVYGWFTEGFDTKDLLEAKALLAELGFCRKRRCYWTNSTLDGSLEPLRPGHLGGELFCHRKSELTFGADARVHLHPLTSQLGRLVGRQPGPFRAARTDSDPARITMSRRKRQWMHRD